MERLLELTKDKTVCLIGNASSILTKEHPEIDGFDVVCRCNHGFPAANIKPYVGSKTDILFTSFGIPAEVIEERLGNPLVIWCTPKRHKCSQTFRKRVDLWFDVLDWINLDRELGERPSTGCMALYMLMMHSPFKSITLYGFDFRKSSSKQKAHQGECEKKYFSSLQKNNDNVFYVTP